VVQCAKKSSNRRLLAYWQHIRASVTRQTCLMLLFPCRPGVCFSLDLERVKVPESHARHNVEKMSKKQHIELGILQRFKEKLSEIFQSRKSILIDLHSISNQVKKFYGKSCRVLRICYYSGYPDGQSRIRQARIATGVRTVRATLFSSISPV
jgi:predicted HAD superfamily phosphohydrolase